MTLTRVLWLSCSYSAGRSSVLKLPACIFAETVSDFVPVRELCFVKNNAVHEHSRRRKSGPLWEQAAASRGIVTRCKGGNTWSIPSCRNVFISLFTNVAISRCVHFKVHCSTGSPSSGAWLQWGTCAGAGASLFEQLAQFSPACTYARRSEGVVPHRVRKNTGLQRDRLYLIQCHRIKRLQKVPQSARARDEKLTAKSVKATSHYAHGVWCQCLVPCEIWESLWKPARSVSCESVHARMSVGDVKCHLFWWD